MIMPYDRAFENEEEELIEHMKKDKNCKANVKEKYRRAESIKGVEVKNAKPKTHPKKDVSMPIIKEKMKDVIIQLAQ